MPLPENVVFGTENDQSEINQPCEVSSETGIVNVICRKFDWEASNLSSRKFFERDLTSGGRDNSSELTQPGHGGSGSTS